MHLFPFCSVCCGALYLVNYGDLRLPCICRRSTEAIPLGVDVASPRFAWQSDATRSNWMQQAYEIESGLMSRRSAAATETSGIGARAVGGLGRYRLWRSCAACAHALLLDGAGVG